MLVRLSLHRRASTNARTLQRLIGLRRLVKCRDQLVKEVCRDGRDYVVITQHLLRAQLRCRAHEITGGLLYQARCMLDLQFGLRPYPELKAC